MEFKRILSILVLMVNGTMGLTRELIASGCVRMANAFLLHFYINFCYTPSEIISEISTHTRQN